MNSKTSDRPSAPSPAPVGDVREFFGENVDRWGALEWFDRMAKAIHGQDAAVLAGDEGRVEICRNVAASSAMRIVREFEKVVRAALTAGEKAGAVAEGAPGLNWQISDETRKQIDEIESNIRHAHLNAHSIVAGSPTTPATSRDRLAREALEPFRKIADLYDDREGDDFRIFTDSYIKEIKNLTLGDCRKARAALQALGGPHE